MDSNISFNDRFDQMTTQKAAHVISSLLNKIKIKFTLEENTKDEFTFYIVTESRKGMSIIVKNIKGYTIVQGNFSSKLKSNVYNKVDHIQKRFEKAVDIIDFIGNHLSFEINTKFLKKVNENVDEEEKKVISKFYSYVNNLPEWNTTNEDSLEQYDPEDDEYPSHTYGLFELEFIDPNNDYPSIQYVVMGYFHDENGVTRDFHVYEDGKFREATDEEDEYLRDIDDDNSELFMSDNSIVFVTFDDWLKAKKNTEKLFKSMNEGKIISKFDDFKLIYNKQRNK